MKKALLLLTALTLALTLSAAERSKAAMQQLAEQTFKKQNQVVGKSVQLVAERPTLAIYSNGSQFSIISRDDRYEAVLAYGLGTFDIEKAPDNVKWWLEAIEEVLNKGITTRRATYTAVSPIMTTKWYQGEPFNNLLPDVKDDDKKTVKPPCGCVATAMAQIMNVQQYPASVDFEGSYTIDGSETVKKEQVTETFSWPYKLAYGAYLPDGYVSYEDVKSLSYSTTEGDAIARLAKACGYAVCMDYSAEGSGSSSIYAAAAFVDYFKYAKTAVKSLESAYYTTDEWMTFISNDLQNGCPILYSGNDKEETFGHAFVVHGIDSDGLLYINWGWQGMFDGYYNIEALVPGDETEKYELTYGQHAVFGIRPTALSTDEYQSSFVTDTPYTLSYKSSKLTLTLTSAMYNASAFDFTGTLRFVMQDMTDANGTIVKTLTDNIEVPCYAGWGSDTELFKGKLNLTTGHSYAAYFETKDNNESEWQKVRAVGGPFYHPITCDTEGKVTISDVVYGVPSTPTGIQMLELENNSDETVHFYNLQGREVSADTPGILLRKQGGVVKKLIVK